MESGKPIWDVIRHARDGKGLSQRELAERLAAVSGKTSVTRDDVKRWETGKRIPRPAWRHWLADVLEIPVERLDVAARLARHARRCRVSSVAPTRP
ncbi:helix-turn-helix domain-containing protein [Phytoactinopolyspora mesophila]|uniref:helix-turn-helix domain-containing protein n=1 Tax=Phytoactinopolyspora mesophila TaxID=2650750 RepID=UPI001C9E5C17